MNGNGVSKYISQTAAAAISHDRVSNDHHRALSSAIILLDLPLPFDLISFLVSECELRLVQVIHR